MKLFFYKTLIVAVAFTLVFKLTFGLVINNFESKLQSFSDKKNREVIIEKVKDEIRSANKKENILDNEERELLSTFLKKLRLELK